jgi:FkbM family methyltransferase
MHIVSPHKKHESLGAESFFAPDSMLRFINKNGSLLPEADLITFVRKEFSNSNKSFVDIGSHIGSYTFELADSFKHVYSFEPAHEAYNYLCSNIILKGLTTKTTTYNVALGSSKKKEVFCVREIDGGTSGLPLVDENNEAVVGHNENSYPVNVETLDSFKLINIGFLKIDVEGYELDVLKGAVNTLIRNNYPSILFECNYMIGCHPDNLQDTFKSAKQKLFVFLVDLGYSISHIKGTEMYIARRSTTLQNLLEHFIKNPDDNLNKFWLGYEYEKIGHCSSAMGYYLSCAENTDDDLLAYECLLRKAAAFRRIGGREAHARNALQLAVALLPRRPEAYYLMSILYEISQDARDEDKWQQAYAWARIGEEIALAFKGERLLTDVGYDGDFVLEFQQAVALWWIGRFSCARKLFNKLLENPFVTEHHREATLVNLKNLSNKKIKPNT